VPAAVEQDVLVDLVGDGQEIVPLADRGQRIELSFVPDLAARIRRSLNYYVREAESLEKLVAIGQKAGISTANYRIYLGQAYARQSLPEPALQNYRAALNSGQLDAKQAEQVQDAINSIESKGTP
jgi:hypothetical protein